MHVITSSRKHKYDHPVNIHPHHLDLFNPWTGFLENIKNPSWKTAKIKKKLMSTHLLTHPPRHRMLEHQIGLKQLAVAQIFIFSRTPSHTSNKSIKLTYTPTGKIEKIEDILVVFVELINFFAKIIRLLS